MEFNICFTDDSWRTWQLLKNFFSQTANSSSKYIFLKQTDYIFESVRLTS